MSEKTNVLQFMTIRAPVLPDVVQSRRVFIRDDSPSRVGPRESDLFSQTSTSEIGKIVYEMIFCFENPDPGGDPAGFLPILARILEMLQAYTPSCPYDVSDPIGLEGLQNRPHVQIGDAFYVVPDRIEHVDAPWAGVLIVLLEILQDAARSEEFDKAALVARLLDVLDGQDIVEVVFDGDGYCDPFLATRRKLFDALYLLYLLRRVVRVNLEHIIAGLGVMHALEAIALDAYLSRLLKQGNSNGTGALLNYLRHTYPTVRAWTFKAPLAGLMITTAEDLLDVLTASPVVHPLFAQLAYFRRPPFNPIKPIGCGDLKVVKLWLSEYQAGEICHIDNVMKGETKTRTHRRLEKTEEVFSFSNEQQEETTRDTQTTDRFEVKREAEQVLKTDTNVTAGANFSLTYQGTGYNIVTGATAGFAFTRSQSDTTKSAQNFARDVIDKAVKRVQSRTSQQRTTTKLFETEETNVHAFTNPPNNQHVSGIYRWVDKKYKAQLYNFGKRMMFEFVLPEPAAFLVESRLRSFEATVELPRVPQKPKMAELPLWLQQMPASAITEQRYRELSERYDLAELPFPPQSKTVDLVDAGSGKAEFAEQNVPGGGVYTARNYVCKVGSEGYRLTRFMMRGGVGFLGQSLRAPIIGTELPAPDDPHPVPRDRPYMPVVPGVDVPAPEQINRMSVSFAGVQIMSLVDNRRLSFVFAAGQDTSDFNITGNRLPAPEATLLLGFWDVGAFSLSFRVDLQRTPELLAEWQAKVRAVVVRAEQKKVDAANQQIEQSYQAELATYRNRLAELRATAVNSLLQGESEAANRQVILRELKRQCLAALTKEFDADATDDRLTDWETMDRRGVDARHRAFKVDETPDSANPTAVKVEFKTVTKRVDFPVIKLKPAADKGRYIQFLEQAFEWQQLSYILYPYFWSTPPKWIDLMNRSDQTDPFLTAFLQAGAVRVLIAVTPAYDDAVSHFLATREPWDGGPAPVIGDPLFLPLHAELRRQQDDLQNAVAEGDPWTFTLPTTLVYLHDSSSRLPDIA